MQISKFSNRWQDERCVRYWGGDQAGADCNIQRPEPPGCTELHCDVARVARWTQNRRCGQGAS